MSNPTHYSGPELGALLAQVREELGEEATILEANKVRSGGIAGFFARESFEISASTEAADFFTDDTDDDPILSDEHTIDDDRMIHGDRIARDDRWVQTIADSVEGDELRLQAEAELAEVLEPLDVIGDLAGTSLSKKRQTRPPAESTQHASVSATQQSATQRPEPPARIADNITPDRPTLVFNFENLGPTAIPTRLEHSAPASSREPIPTPSPLRSQLESSSVPSTTVGERVADALMERAELVNALEHLDKTDELIAAQFDESPQSLATLSDTALSDASFEQILQRTLTTPYVEESETEEGETLTTAEAVAQRIASQGQPDKALIEVPDPALADRQTEQVQTTTQGPVADQVKALPLEAGLLEQEPAREPIQEPVGESVQEPMNQPAADMHPSALTSRLPIPIEPGATQQRPDFWSRMSLAQEEIALYQLGRSNVTAIVGPLDLALPVARRCQQDDWIGVHDLAILSSRASIPGVPSWQAVSKVDDLYWAMNEWCANQRRGLVVVDTADLSSSQLLRHITQLRSNGADMIRLAIPAGLDVADFVTLSNEIGGKLAVDLPSGTEPSAILGALDEGLMIGSVGGRSLTPELLVALRIEVSRPELSRPEASRTGASPAQSAGSGPIDNDIAGS